MSQNKIPFRHPRVVVSDGSHACVGHQTAAAAIPAHGGYPDTLPEGPAVAGVLRGFGPNSASRLRFTLPPEPPVSAAEREAGDRALGLSGERQRDQVEVERMRAENLARTGGDPALADAIIRHLRRHDDTDGLDGFRGLSCSRCAVGVRSSSEFAAACCISMTPGLTAWRRSFGGPQWRSA